ncbi:divalent metal cation transporter [Pelagicoccus mobilis]|uniref:Divalent metal cation transporter n=1 Tax=Pelagicoccus mobilis TaxID=415221 RepID=A0A934VTU7_9BACT|nr:divalent metal cation transporter [Pelagicoccus mobilis]MBK1879874.1 divalent metal cation transporter [Pelagicoccus mobilis]
MSQDRASQELEMLRDAKKEGGLATLKTYTKLSGPGWLQSAITLGGGSLSGALFLGVIGGYEFMWVQMLAMIMGVIMLSAISYVTLSTEASPFRSLKDNINPVLAWGWLIASMMANLVWVLPQYSLAYAALSQNLMPEAFANATGDGSKYLVSIIIFAIVTGITLCYGSKGLGIKIYEWTLKIVVAGIVISFMGVVIKLATSAEDFSMGEVLVGFIPDFGTWFRPAQTYEAFLATLDPEARDYWTEQIVSAQRTRLIGAASAAVGINMTFLLPYSMLNKGWKKDHRGLAIFDLSTGMVIPFVIAVSCVVIAAAYMFHGKPFEGLLIEENGIVQVDETNKGYGAYSGMIAGRDSAAAANPDFSATLSDGEKRIAALLINRDTGAFANSLSTLTENKAFSNTVFGIGVLAMALSTISMLMLISGFVFSEMLGVPHGGMVHKVGILCGGTGILWPLLWSGGSKAFLAIVTSTIGYIFLPISFLAFFLMMNSKSVLGDELPQGGKRVLWNVLMGISLIITGSAAAYTATTKVLFGFPIGTVGLVGFVVAVIAGQIYMAKKR